MVKENSEVLNKKQFTTPLATPLSSSSSSSVPDSASINDIAYFVNRTLAHNEIDNVINNIWVPDINFNFPITSNGDKKKSVKQPDFNSNGY